MSENLLFTVSADAIFKPFSSHAGAKSKHAALVLSGDSAVMYTGTLLLPLIQNRSVGIALWAVGQTGPGLLLTKQDAAF